MSQTRSCVHNLHWKITSHQTGRYNIMDVRYWWQISPCTSNQVCVNEISIQLYGLWVMNKVISISMGGGGETNHNSSPNQQSFSRKATSPQWWSQSIFHCGLIIKLRSIIHNMSSAVAFQSCFHPYPIIILNLLNWFICVHTRISTFNLDRYWYEIFVDVVVVDCSSTEWPQR